jgi:predicted enzyme related to lactoylglutathione lyase
MDAISWFEIPVADFDRARKFYGEIYGKELHTMDMLELKMALIPMDSREGVGGSLVYGESYEPSVKGSLVYLNAGNDLNEMLGRVEKAGGKVLMDKKQITPEIGYMALILDSEGNRIALHSPN